MLVTPKTTARLLMLVLVAACGGTTLDDVLGGGPGASDGDVLSGLDAALGDGAVTVDGSVTSDAVAPDAGPTVDANVPDTSGRIPLDCPSLEIKDGPAAAPGKCDVRTEVCCRAPGGASFSCTAQKVDTSCVGLRIPCTEYSDCQLRSPGMVCCAMTSGGIATKVGCAPQDECVIEFGRTIACNPNDANPCPNGGVCKKSEQTLPGFNLCLQQ